MPETFHSAGGFSGIQFPTLDWYIIAPEPIIDSDRFGRLHNRILKSCLRAVLMEHFAKVTPGHFKSGASGKYDYQKRTPTTQRIKQKLKHHNVDLVFSGRTERHMTARVPSVQIAGSAESTLSGTIRLRFPFPISRDVKDPRHVSMAQMGIEIASWTEEEKRNAVERMAELYAADLRHELASKPKWKVEAEQKGFS